MKDLYGNEYIDTMRALLSDERIRKMKDFRHHGNISTFDHSRRVARLSYILNKCLSLKCDPDTLLLGAMLHDYYLYDWHSDDWEHGLHGFTHPETASKNAKEHFGVNGKTENVIRTHMWPLDPTKIPRSREAWLVCVADKLASLRETVLGK